MSSFGVICDRIVRAILAARELDPAFAGAPVSERCVTTAGEWPPSMPGGPGPIALSLARLEEAEMTASGGGPRNAGSSTPPPRSASRSLPMTPAHEPPRAAGVPASTCLEICGDSFVADRPLDPATFDELRAAGGNPLDLCDFALSCSTCRHAGDTSVRSARRVPVGDHLATMAHLEASCVGAFGDLADELEGHGAPSDLVVRARHAQDDERVHAVLLGRLATRHGGAPPAPPKKHRKPRSLSALACQNAREGCGAEAFNALAMSWAAHTARDLTMRALARRIAEDEARHVDLAFDIQAWLTPALPASKAAQLRGIRDLAIRSIARETAPVEVETALGKPSLTVAEHLAEKLIEELGAHGLPGSRE